jgi:serine/threonine protein kinase
MGVVYLAEDTKLERKVAIKFLPRHIAGSSEERQRFEIEAKAAAALNHPNIATIHAIEEVDDDMFLVMEYIDGMELKEKLKSGPLDFNVAKRIALQIGRGLQTAHQNNIIHRDIKSNNIMITETGDVKIMDFGLAKFRGSAQLTKVGTTVGTAAYMSPEQARSEELDHRSDIWSFGVVLYEMLSGELLFKGDYEQAIIFSILNDEIDFSVLNKQDVPSQFTDVLKKILQKDAAKRYQSMADVITSFEAPDQHSTQKRSYTQYIIYGILVVFIVILLLWNKFNTFTMPIDKPQTKVTKITFDPGLEDEPTWSPDGKFLAYTTDERDNFDIIVKPLDGGKPIRIVEHEADDAQASWSPDGSSIAFVSSRDHADHLSIVLNQSPLTQFLYAKNGDIYTMPALGGQQIKVVENGYYPQWSPDSKMLTYQSNTNGDWNIWITSVKGGEPIQLTNDSDFDYHPSWSGDGKWIVYASRFRQESNFHIKVVPAKGGEPLSLLETVDQILNPRISIDHKFLIFSSTRNGAYNITKVPLDIDQLETIKEYQSITLSESDDVSVQIGYHGQHLIYTSVTNNPDIYELNLNSGIITAIISDNADNDLAHLSPDGTRLLFTSDRSGKRSAWIKNLGGTEIYNANTDIGGAHRWSPDGSSIIYADDNGLILKKPGDAFKKVLLPFAEYGRIGFPMISWDHTYVTFSGDSGLSYYNMNTDSYVRLTDNETDDHPTWSPDNNYIVFQRGQGTGRDLYYVDLNGNHKQLTSGETEDSHPFWSPVNKDEILFLRDHKNLFLLTISTGKLRQITEYKKANITLDYPTLSADGQKVFYSLFNKIGDIYVLENY